MWSSEPFSLVTTTASGIVFPALTNLIARYRADVGVTAPGGNVTAVVDQSGNNNNLVNDGVVPLTAGYNSNPSFGFIAANSAVLKCLSFGIGTGTALSVFMIGQMSTNTQSFGGCCCYSNGGDDYSTPGGFALSRDSTNAGINPTTSGDPAPMAMSTGANHRWGATFDTSGSISPITPYVDNVPGTPGVVGGAPIPWVTGGLLSIGSRVIGGVLSGGYWEGPISEIVICAAILSGAELNALDNYFTQQWGT